MRSFAKRIIFGFHKFVVIWRIAHSKCLCGR